MSVNGMVRPCSCPASKQRRRHRAAVAEIDELSEKAITQPPASLQNAKRRPSLASRLASFATSVSLVDAALSPMDAARRCLRPIWVGVAHS
jgi:hypothetical protein